MIKVVEFKPEHLVNIEKDGIDGEVVNFLGEIDKRAADYAQAGPAITLLDGDTILAIGGVIMCWKGVGEAWMMVSPEGRLKKVALYKTMEGFVNTCFEKYGMHRIQTSILCLYPEAHKCILRLGFIPEGMMVHYGPRKENYMRYVKLRD